MYTGCISYVMRGSRTTLTMRQGEGNSLPSLTITFTLTPVMPMDKEIQAEDEGVRVKVP